MIKNNRPTSQRVHRDLTPDERQRVEIARAETEAAKQTILAEGRQRKRAWKIARNEVRRTVATLKSERERLGLSLADIESRSGLKRSALSRLENDPDANPTLLTLQRYATAIGMKVATSVELEA
ncbi:MAG: helix-turn-helix transcriptional regulator [Candidatus Paceibacterota bacterium]